MTTLAPLSRGDGTRVVRPFRELRRNPRVASREMVADHD